MDVNAFVSAIGSQFFCGVPDSQLKPLCDYLLERYGVDGKHHLITANEGNAIGVAAGYYLGTGKVPVVYMQNSGEGNAINPLASLMNPDVYGIPCLLVIGWRGEPGIHDEPQHVYQGKITLKLLEDLGIAYYVLSSESTEEEIRSAMDQFAALFKAGKQAAFVIRKGALTYAKSEKGQSNPAYSLSRERAIELLVNAVGDDFVVSTTGKASRELFEIRERLNQGHGHDFLTVGSMGHASSIALGLALQREDERFWVFDGDGALLMHMGAMPVIGSQSPKNLVHVVLNNGTHDTVGGQPTCMPSVKLLELASACGYSRVLCAKDEDTLLASLSAIKEEEPELTLLEICVATGARANLGRPTNTPGENKASLMKCLCGLEDR